MRRKILAGVFMALAFVIPAAPAVAQTGAIAQTGLPGLNEECQTVERKVYKDIRELLTIDLDTAPIVEVRLLATRILTLAEADSLVAVRNALRERLNGTDADLRAFLKTDLLAAWALDLLVAMARTLVDAGANVQAAGQEALRSTSIDVHLAYLNDGLYDARELDCASASPSAPASTSPSASVSASASSAPTPGAGPSSAAAGGSGGSLPITGANISSLALGGVALIMFGVGGVLVARRFRT